MADAYISVAGAGAKTGVDAANAYDATQFQLMLDNLAAGDTGWVQDGVYTLAVSLDIDTNSGAVANLIRLTGVNNAWADDGTRPVIDGNGAAVNCFDIDNVNYWYFKNFEFTSATGDNIDTANTPDRLIFQNCYSYSSGARGFDLSAARYATVVQCAAVNNNNEGFRLYSCKLFDCVAINNTTGIYGLSSQACDVANCIAHNNSSNGVAYCATVDGCTLDDNVNGVLENTTNPVNITRCRITHNTNGIRATTIPVSYYKNLFFNNGTKINTTTEAVDMGGNIDAAADGYTNRAADDFTLTIGGEGVSVATPVGRSDEASNIAYYVMGIPPAYPALGAPSSTGISRFEPLTNGYYYLEWDAGTGTITGYKIFIRAGGAPTWAAGEIAFLAKPGTTSVVLHIEGDGDFLAHGITYHCGVRADNAGTDDGNTASLSNICSGPSGIQRQINTNVVIR